MGRRRRRKNRLEKLYECKHCKCLYHWKNSRSSLKMSYCNTICEVAGLGFHLSSFEKGLYEKRGPVVEVASSISNPALPDEPLEELKEDDDNEGRELVSV